MVNAYVPNADDNTVSVIDTASQTVIATIDVGNTPVGAAVTPDGTKAYVTNSSDGTVSVIDTATGTVIATIDVGTVPGGLAVTPDSTKAYVANYGDGSPGEGTTVSVIDTASQGVIATIDVGTGPIAVAITPDGTQAYVTNDADGTVSVIDIASGTVTATIDVGTHPQGIAITPNGSYAYVVNQESETVSVIDTSSGAVTATITLGNLNPTAVAITPDVSYAYVTNTDEDDVWVIDISTNTVSTSISVGVGASPIGIAITPDGTLAYVLNFGSSSVAVIDTSTNTVSTTITVGNKPRALGQFIQPASIPMTNTYAAPQGRLTLTSNTPVMTADATAQTSVYYTPYQGNIVPIYDGANMQSYTFGQLTMALNTSNQLSTKLYDLFVFLNSSVVTIGAGPAWSSGTSRGTGSGTTQLQQIDGLWVNANTITLTNGSTSYSSIPVGEATYIGTVYMTANGQTGMQFKPAAASGGANPILGLYNAYNRIRTLSSSSDNTSSWTYTTATWRAADNNNNNRISFVDGLQQSFIDTSYTCGADTTSTSIAALVGVSLNSTSSAPVRASVTVNSAEVVPVKSQENFDPQLGVNYIQAMEYSSGSTTTFFGKSSGVSATALQISLDM
jgi:YVTN family beta-propeller protein